MIALRLICGLTVRWESQNLLPKAPFILACKHQSALETFALNVCFATPVFVLKRELLKIPVYGSYLRYAGMISIDRQAGVQALRRMAASMSQAFAAKRVAVIFPEGTRSTPGQVLPYKPGIAFIHAVNPDIPIVPAALNTGLFWPKGGLIIKPGEAVIQFLPPLQGRMEREELLATLSDRIETASLRLLER